LSLSGTQSKSSLANFATSYPEAVGKTVAILDVPIDAVTLTDVIQKIEQIICSKEGEKLRVATPNPEFIVRSVQDERFARTLKSAGLRIADGSGLIWASYYLQLPWRGYFIALGEIFYYGFSLIFAPQLCYRYLPMRTTGVDLAYYLAETAAKKGWKMFLLGAAAGVAEQTKAVLEQRYPEIQITGTYAGSPHPAEAAAIRQRIDASQADILLVAYGAPKQDFWLEENLAQLETVKVGIGVGGTLDFIAGRVKRAPALLRHLHLEWLWRLVLQPWRLLRISKATLYFVYLVYQERVKQRRTVPINAKIR